MSQTIEVPVHCCCHPDRRLGWLAVPPDWVQRGHLYVVRAGCRQVQLTIEQLYTEGDRVVTLAIKSDDRPIEFWRSLPGFREDPV